MEVHEKVMIFYITITNKARGKRFSEYYFWEHSGHMITLQICTRWT